MNALVLGKTRTPSRARTLLAHAGTVWMWPGIALTEKRGAASVPVPHGIARFWISRLHGSEVNDLPVLRCLDIAAQKLNEGDEAGAQKALDASELNRLSPDGVALARAVAGSLGIAPLGLPWTDGPRLWRAEEIAAHVSLFKEYAPAAKLLAKMGGWDESKHPRMPAGSPEGGRFTGGGGAPIVEGRSAAPGIGHNGGPLLEPPPEIPKNEPPTSKLRNDIVKLAAKWALKALTRGELGPLGAFLTAAEAASWLCDKYPFIKAYLDAPKSLEELQSDVRKPEKGYEVHHIVEQAAASRDGHSDEDIDGPENLVRIPTLKHWEITGWYMTKNDDYGGLSPRAYLEGKSWHERRRVGLDALIRFGVLQ